VSNLLRGVCASGVSILLAAMLGASASRSPEVTVGQRRMVAELDRLAVEARDGDNPYFGTAQLRELERRLAASPANAPDPLRWRYHALLGRLRLRLGQVEPAIEHYLAANAEAKQLSPLLPRDERVNLVFETGLAYMRLGATQNCGHRLTGESCILPIRGRGVYQRQAGSENAIRVFTSVLRALPPDSAVSIRARWLLNLAAMTLGRYPDGVPEAWRIDPRVFESAQPFPRFANIAPRLGLAAFNLAGGAVAEDLDGDGFLDVLLSSWDPDGAMRYFKNAGDGTFIDRSTEAGLTGLRGGLNMVQADYDNDGDVDVLVLRGAWMQQWGRHPNSLLRNRGDGTFVDVTWEAGLAEPYYPTQSAAWGDYDLDGDLDLYVGNETSATVRAPGQLFRNNGDGTFTDVAPRAGVENGRYAKAVTWGDYDGDRWPDLYVSNIGQENRLYRNNRDGTFTDVAPALGVTRPLTSFPAWFWDFDNDGALDIAAFGYGGGAHELDVVDVAASYLGLPFQAELPCLYHGDGKGGFAEVGARFGLTQVTLPMGSNFGDLDNDGWPEIYLGTGYPGYEGLMPNVMYHNERGRGFTDVSTAGGFANLQKGHGVVFADLDQDGDQDVFEEMGGAFPGDAFGSALYENPGFGNHWVKVKLVGVRSNRAGVGARIRAEISEDGRRRSVYKHVNSGGSFGANPVLRQEIGLGRAQRIELLEVFWPVTGLTQSFPDVPADRFIEITEGQPGYRTLSLQSFAFKR